jgi:hypothetical protein
MKNAIDFSSDVEALPADKLAQVAELARKLREQKLFVADLEQQLENAKAVFVNIEQVLLPAAMTEIGMKGLTLSSGAELEIKREYHPGLTEETELAAFQWLRANQYEEIIKRNIIVQFGKGDDKLATQLLDLIKKKIPATTPLVDKAAIHYQTLKAFCKNRLEEEAEEAAEDPEFVPSFPKELFGVHVIDRAVIKEPKK